MDIKTLLEDYVKILDRYEKAFEEMITIIFENEPTHNSYVGFFHNKKYEDTLPKPHIEMLDYQTREICNRLEKLYEIKECLQKFKSL